jgi:chaperonin cofactor prefoldin
MWSQLVTARRCVTHSASPTTDPLTPPPSSSDAQPASVTPPVRVAAPRSSEEIALEESHNQQRQVDPFRIGYNMGMQNIHLETLRNKLDDNVELLKSHFNSLRETQRNSQDTLRAMQVEYNKQTRKQFDDGVDSLREKLDQLSQRMSTNEDMMRELSRQQFESLQKHVDDRLENIKDTVKLSVGILFALNLWILFLVNQSLAGAQHRASQPPQQMVHHSNMTQSNNNISSKMVDSHPPQQGSGKGEGDKKRGWF